MKSGMIKVYKIETQGETEWLAFDGEIRQALEFYIDEYDNSDDIDSISIFPQKYWKSTRITLEDEEGTVVTIEEYMKDHEGNGIIASTVY